MWWLSWIAGCGMSDPHRGIDVEDPQACVACHEPLVEEWAEAMHSRSHASRDPLFAAMKDLRTEKQGAEITAKCGRCHAPRSPAADDTDAARAGVSCAACHLTEDGSMGLVAEGNALCATCHEATKTPSGVAACTTGPEHAAFGEQVLCSSCHMPVVDGSPTRGSDVTTHVSHAFLGPHRAWLQDDRAFLSQAVGLSLAFRGDTLVVELGNRTGHGFPTGFPGREAMLTVTLVDASGVALVEQTHRLGKRYTDDEGVAKPAAFATKLAEDTRLKPSEVRRYELAVPEGTTRADARVGYRLLPEKLAATLGLAGTPEAEAVYIATERAIR